MAHYRKIVVDDEWNEITRPIITSKTVEMKIRQEIK